MSRYPGAIWKPIEAQYLSGLRMAAYNRINLHVAVSEAPSLHGFFNAKGCASSHFYVRKDGTVEQYVDTAYRAEADLDGNDATISIETQGGLAKPQQEPWTDAQVTALASLFAWAVAEHGIEPRLAKDSKPGPSSRGLSWHRLGVDPWRVDGGMRYSLARGKVCPGDAKIAQIPTILALALGETDTKEDDVAITQGDLENIREAAANGTAQLFAEMSTGATKRGRNARNALQSVVGVDEAALGQALAEQGVTGVDVSKLATTLSKRVLDDMRKRLEA